MTHLLTWRRCLLALAFYLVFALLVLAITPFIGAESLHFRNIVADLTADGPPSIDTTILLEYRLNRVGLGFLVGGTLALIGSVFQVILRNPLATPYTLGVTGGGALGAVVALFIPHLTFSVWLFSTVQFFALLGASLTLLLIYLIARRPQGLSMHTLLLAGVTIGILCGALISIIRYLARPHELVSMEHWMLGSLAVTGYQDLVALAPLLVPGLILLLAQMPRLNHLALGEQMAQGHGIDVVAVQRLCFLGGALATAAVVSVAGPIGFVGLLVPHAVRRLSGLDHRVVLPACFLTGGALLVLCDAIARTLVAPTEIPVGIITALVGAPFFIYLLLGKTSSSF